MGIQLFRKFSKSFKVYLIVYLNFNSVYNDGYIGCVGRNEGIGRFGRVVFVGYIDPVVLFVKASLVSILSRV